MTAPAFDPLADCYETLIDWPKRLAHEGPFFHRLFAMVEAERVLDAACGTGHHAALFHSWGLRVEGADISASMLAQARLRFGEPTGLRWTCRGFDEPVPVPAAFDAAICVGNSLALAPDLPTARRAVTCMLAALKPGGVVVFHVLNLWRLTDGPCLWQKCVPIHGNEGPGVIVKGVHRHGTTGYVDLLVTRLAAEPELRSESVRFLGLEGVLLEQWVCEAGAGMATLYGGYHDEPYDRATSIDLILVAQKPL
ncbi:MAG: class I SAM-dependent DNA methyltransferase [Pirellulaceae bacterium]